MKKCYNNIVDKIIKANNIGVLNFIFNKNKKQICDVYIDGTLYPIYEYDLNDLKEIEDFSKNNSSEVDTMLLLLKCAIPTCPVEKFLNLTQSEYHELLSMIHHTKSINNLINASSTIH